MATKVVDQAQDRLMIKILFAQVFHIQETRISRGISSTVHSHHSLESTARNPSITGRWSVASNSSIVLMGQQTGREHLVLNNFSRDPTTSSNVFQPINVKLVTYKNILIIN